MRRVAVMLVPLALLAGCGGESAAHKAARDDAHTTATYYCTMQPGLTAAGAIYTDEYKNCVKQETQRFLAEWEAKHPND